MLIPEGTGLLTDQIVIMKTGGQPNENQASLYVLFPSAILTC